MHCRLAAALFALLYAACSKTEQPAASQQPAVPPIPPAALSTPAPTADTAAPKVADVVAAPEPPPAEGTVPAPASMRAGASTKPVPAPVAPPRVPPVRPEKPAMLGSAKPVVDDIGVERIALTPGARPPEVIVPKKPAPVTVPAAIPAAAKPALATGVVGPSVLAAPEIIRSPAAANAPAPAGTHAQYAANSAASRPLQSASPEHSEPQPTATAPTVATAPAAKPIASVLDPQRKLATINELIVDSINLIPPGGDYRADAAAIELLKNAVTISDGSIVVIPDIARPSFCSSATYMVFLMAMDRLQRSNRLQLSPTAMEALMITGQPDGEGVWGRWNANGPGTARLFHEMGVGKSFTNPMLARPGDFLKIWWNEEIGAKERGHSVIFLGVVKTEKGEMGIHYWSSNKPGGFGQAVAPMSTVKRMLFSRLDTPRALNNAARIPLTDTYLMEMLKRDSTEDEMLKMSGVQ